MDRGEIPVLEAQSIRRIARPGGGTACATNPPGGQETTIAVPRCERQQRDGMSDNPPELWDIDRVCPYLGCSKHLVYRLARESIGSASYGSAGGCGSARLTWPPGWRPSRCQPGRQSPSGPAHVVDAPATGIGPHESEEVAGGRTASSVAQRHRHV